LTQNLAVQSTRPRNAVKPCCPPSFSHAGLSVWTTCVCACLLRAIMQSCFWTFPFARTRISFCSACP